MRVGELDPELRRAYCVVFLDDGVTFATAAEVSPPAHAFQVSVNGAAPVDATGNFVGDGEGEYYYEFSVPETSTAAFVAFKLERPGHQIMWVTADVGDLFTVGETNPARLRLPLVIFDDSSPPQLALATVTSPSQLQTALNDVAFADAAGSLVPVGSGLHYYQGVPGDAADEGSLAVRFVKAGFQTQVVWTPISSPSSLTSTPTLASLSPTPLTPPGDPGGFPRSTAAADLTPVVAAIDQAVPNLAEIVITFVVDGVEEIAFYAGMFRGHYLTGSYQVISGDRVTLHMLRVGGWSHTAGQMALTISGLSPSIFSLTLPTSTGAETRSLVVAPAAGAVDHLGEMLSRLPRQFRGKPRIETMVRVLCKPIQEFENIVVDVLAHLGVDTAFGAKLKMIARLVGQSTDGFTDDEVLRRFIRAKIATNRSSGTIPELITITRLVLASPATDLTVETVSVASIVVTLLNAPTTIEIAATLLQFLRRAKSSAVRVKIVFFNTSPLFRFDSGPGFDQGHLMSSIE